MSQTTNWHLIQEEIKKGNWLFTITLTNSSYLRIGGFNARPYSLELILGEKIRPSKIKGILRWWLRIITLGRNHNPSSYKEIEIIIGKYLGSDKKEEGQSKFLLNVISETNDEKINEFRNEMFKMIDQYTSQLLNFKYKHEGKEINKIPIEKINLDLHPASLKIEFELKKELENKSIINELKKLIEKELGSIVRINKINIKKDKRDKYKRSNRIIASLELNDSFKLLKELANIPRMKLILMERKEEKGDAKKYINRIKEEFALYPPNSIKIKISFYEKPKDTRERIINIIEQVLIGLILMIIFQGLSAFSSRGFAGCKLLDVDINPKLNDSLKDIHNICKKIINSKDKKDLEESINELIKSLNIKELISTPNVPTLDSSFKYFQFRVFEVKQNYSAEKILKIINESVMKSTWKQLDRQAIKIPGEGYHTWILGLPRTQRNTGYIVFRNGEREETFRRKSAIGINIFETNNKKFVILHGFISRDWPIYTEDKQGKKLILKHLSPRYKEGEEITKIMDVYNTAEVVHKAFSQAFKYVESKLKEVESM
jgi:CRISPR type III-B/RAMP module RAMP protein Cmr1